MQTYVCRIVVTITLKIVGKEQYSLLLLLGFLHMLVRRRPQEKHIFLRFWITRSTRLEPRLNQNVLKMRYKEVIVDTNHDGNLL